MTAAETNPRTRRPAHRERLANPEKPIVTNLTMDDVVEELQQLRAAISVYRRLVERLLEERAARG